MPSYRVNTPQGAITVNGPEGAEPSAIFGFIKALADSQFWQDVGSRLHGALKGGLEDVFPTGAAPGSSLAQRGAQVDPAYREKMLNLGLAGMTFSGKIPARLEPGMKLYHGTQSDINQLRGITYLSTDPAEAAVFARGEIPGTQRGAIGKVAGVYEAKVEGSMQVKNIDEAVQKEIMESGDIDPVIKAELEKARAEGYGAISFLHPSGVHGGEFAAIVPTYPGELSLGAKQASPSVQWPTKGIP